MTDDEAIAAAIGDLDGEELGAFVADLYRARGWSVERDGQRLNLARDGERETLVVRPASRRARLFGPNADGSETVVSARPGEGDLDRSNLVSMLRYGVPPETGAELGERHLGAPPAALDPPKRIRARRELAGLPLGEVGVAVAVLLTAAALVISIPVGGLLVDSTPAATGPNGTTTDADPTRTDATTEPGQIEDAATTESGRVVANPDVNESDFTPDAIASAHREVLANHTYRLRITEVSETDLSERPMVVREVVKQAGDSYVYRIRSKNDAGTVPGRDVYSNGTDTFVAGYRSADAPFRYSHLDTDPPSPREWTTARLRSAINTTNRSVESVRIVGDRREYRVVGTGAPPSIGARDYRVEMVVTGTGLVRSLNVDYAGPEGWTVSVSWSHELLDDDTVTPPLWYERQFESIGNRTNPRNTTVADPTGTTTESTVAEA